MTECQV